MKMLLPKISLFFVLAVAVTSCNKGFRASFFDDPLAAYPKNEALTSKKPVVETPETRRQSLLKTWEGYVFLCGWENGIEEGYDISKLTKEEKEVITRKGLENLSQVADFDDTDTSCSYVLNRYYYNKKDYKKAMYWAFRGAEKGSPDCMLSLSKAYRSGEGVVQDLAEGIKWTLLGAAIGDKWCMNWVNDNGASLLMDASSSHIMTEAQIRANEWMNQHPNFFISRD